MSARPHYEQQLHLARELQDRRGEATALSNLGRLSIEAADLARAVELLRQAADLFHSAGDQRGEGNAFWSLSLAFEKLVNWEQARVCNETALRIREAIQDPNLERTRQHAEQLRAK